MSKFKGKPLDMMELPKIPRNQWGERVPFHKKLLFASQGRGWDAKGDGAEDALYIGHIYTATHIEIHSGSSWVELAECPGRKFNTVCFVDLEHITEMMRE